MKKKYYTQMEAARKNIITPEMKSVAAKEDRPVEFIRERVANGTIVIPANPLHISLDPNGIGSMLKTKINVNLGVPWKHAAIPAEIMSGVPGHDRYRTGV